jgi:hypothetical protein
MALELLLRIADSKRARPAYTLGTEYSRPVNLYSCSTRSVCDSIISSLDPKIGSSRYLTRLIAVHVGPPRCS